MGQSVIIGDSVDLADSLISNRPDALVIIDPPWDAGLFGVGSVAANRLVFFDGFRGGDAISSNGSDFCWLFTWDCVTSWYTPGRPLRRGKYCAWYGSISEYNSEGFLYGEPCGRTRVVTNSRGRYIFEPSAGKHLSDIFSSPITSLRKSQKFGHSKPLDWITMLLANCGGGRPVIDLFAGSGAFGIASKVLGLEYVGVEIDERRAEEAQSAIEGYQYVNHNSVQEELWPLDTTESTVAQPGQK